MSKVSFKTPIESIGSSIDRSRSTEESRLSRQGVRAGECRKHHSLWLLQHQFREAPSIQVPAHYRRGRGRVPSRLEELCSFHSHQPPPARLLLLRSRVVALRLCMPAEWSEARAVLSRSHLEWWVPDRSARHVS